MINKTNKKRIITFISVLLIGLSFGSSVFARTVNKAEAIKTNKNNYGYSSYIPNYEDSFKNVNMNDINTQISAYYQDLANNGVYYTLKKENSEDNGKSYESETETFFGYDSNTNNDQAKILSKNYMEETHPEEYKALVKGLLHNRLLLDYKTIATIANSFDQKTSHDIAYNLTAPVYTNCSSPYMFEDENQKSSLINKLTFGNISSSGLSSKTIFDKEGSFYSEDDSFSSTPCYVRNPQLITDGYDARIELQKRELNFGGFEEVGIAPILHLAYFDTKNKIDNSKITNVEYVDKENILNTSLVNSKYEEFPDQYKEELASLISKDDIKSLETEVTDGEKAIQITGATTYVGEIDLNSVVKWVKDGTIDKIKEFEGIKDNDKFVPQIISPALENSLGSTPNLLLGSRYIIFNGEYNMTGEKKRLAIEIDDKMNEIFMDKAFPESDNGKELFMELVNNNLQEYNSQVYTVKQDPADFFSMEGFISKGLEGRLSIQQISPSLPVDNYENFKVTSYWFLESYKGKISVSADKLVFKESYEDSSFFYKSFFGDEYLDSYLRNYKVNEGYLPNVSYNNPYTEIGTYTGPRISWDSLGNEYISGDLATDLSNLEADLATGKITKDEDGKYYSNSKNIKSLLSDATIKEKIKKIEDGDISPLNNKDDYELQMAVYRKLFPNTALEIKKLEAQSSFGGSINAFPSYQIPDFKAGESATARRIIEDEETYYLINKYANLYGVDPFLMVAKFATESGGRHEPYANEATCSIRGCGIGQIDGVYPGFPGWGENYNGIRTVTAFNHETKSNETQSITFGGVGADLDASIKEDNIKFSTMYFAGLAAGNYYNIPVTIQGYNFGQSGIKQCIGIYLTSIGVDNSPEAIDEYIKSRDNSWLASNARQIYKDIKKAGTPTHYDKVIANYIGNDPFFIDKDGNILSMNGTAVNNGNPTSVARDRIQRIAESDLFLNTKSHFYYNYPKTNRDRFNQSSPIEYYGKVKDDFFGTIDIQKIEPKYITTPFETSDAEARLDSLKKSIVLRNMNPSKINFEKVYFNDLNFDELWMTESTELFQNSNGKIYAPTEYYFENNPIQFYGKEPKITETFYESGSRIGIERNSNSDENKVATFAAGTVESVTSDSVTINLGERPGPKTLTKEQYDNNEKSRNSSNDYVLDKAGVYRELREVKVIFSELGEIDSKIKPGFEISAGEIIGESKKNPNENDGFVVIEEDKDLETKQREKTAFYISMTADGKYINPTFVTTYKDPMGGIIEDYGDGVIVPGVTPLKEELNRMISNITPELLAKLRVVRLQRGDVFGIGLTNDFAPLGFSNWSEKFIYNGGGSHDGFDVGYRTGKVGGPIYAPADMIILNYHDGCLDSVGTSSKCGPPTGGGYGNAIIGISMIDFGSGPVAVWVNIAHNQNGSVDKYLVGERDIINNPLVRQGQRIASLGSSGSSSGPHIHYEFNALGTGDINEAFRIKTTVNNNIKMFRNSGATTSNPTPTSSALIRPDAVFAPYGYRGEIRVDVPSSNKAQGTYEAIIRSENQRD